MLLLIGLINGHKMGLPLVFTKLGDLSGAKVIGLVGYIELVGTWLRLDQGKLIS